MKSLLQSSYVAATATRDLPGGSDDTPPPNLARVATNNGSPPLVAADRQRRAWCQLSAADSGPHGVRPDRRAFDDATSRSVYRRDGDGRGALDGPALAKHPELPRTPRRLGAAAIVAGGATQATTLYALPRTTRPRRWLS